jgi:hypothetical protein
MRRNPRVFSIPAILAVGLLCARCLPAQEAAPRPRPPEGSIIIDLPSTEVPAAGTLSLLVTHRFASPVQGSDIHSLFSFDSGADIGLGLSYAPLTNLEIGMLRNKSLEDYEFAAKYRLVSLADGAFSAALRGGMDYRGRSQLSDHASGFAQAILAVSFLSRVRVSAIPSYTSRTFGQITGVLVPPGRDVFNVPVALSAAITPSFNVHGEYVPRHENPGAGWIVSVEKTVLRHRFSFTAGTLRPTTVDQYLSYDFEGLPTSNIYLGFNIVRQWKLK